MNNFILSIFLIILNYLIGSISSAILIARYVKKVDIRKIGYKTAGGSNVSKSIGIKWGILVAFFDVLKGIPILILAKYLDISNIYQVFIGISAVMGHCWPIWFNFSGGRGIGTLLGIITILTPQISIYPISIFFTTLIPSLLEKLKIINLKLISSPTLTLLALFVYIILTLETSETFDNILSLTLFVLVLTRRVTARSGEYKSTDSPIKLFFSRLIFDNSNTL